MKYFLNWEVSEGEMSHHWLDEGSSVRWTAAAATWLQDRLDINPTLIIPCRFFPEALQGFYVHLVSRIGTIWCWTLWWNCSHCHSNTWNTSKLAGGGRIVPSSNYSVAHWNPNRRSGSAHQFFSFCIDIIFVIKYSHSEWQTSITWPPKFTWEI